MIQWTIVVLYPVAEHEIASSYSLWMRGAIFYDNAFLLLRKIT